MYRAFFYERYKSLFAHPNSLIAVSALSFGLMHLIFGNWVAVVLSAAGGFMFSRTYMHTRSLALVTAEHALYGVMIFTVGLGRYFFTGAAW